MEKNLPYVIAALLCERVLEEKMEPSAPYASRIGWHINPLQFHLEGASPGIQVNRTTLRTYMHKVRSCNWRSHLEISRRKSKRKTHRPL